MMFANTSLDSLASTPPPRTYARCCGRARWYMPADVCAAWCLCDDASKKHLGTQKFLSLSRCQRENHPRRAVFERCETKMQGLEAQTSICSAWSPSVARVSRAQPLKNSGTPCTSVIFLLPRPWAVIFSKATSSAAERTMMHARCVSTSWELEHIGCGVVSRWCDLCKHPLFCRLRWNRKLCSPARTPN